MAVMNLFAGQQWRNIENRLMDTGGGEDGEGECLERVTWKLTIPYVK